ncbi:MAG: ATP-binding cassette domain-containing protein [Chloroflexota bacterium]
MKAPVKATWGMWAFIRALPRLLFPHLGWFLLSVLALAPAVLMATGMPLMLRALIDRALAANNAVTAIYALGVIALLALLDVGTAPLQRWLASRMATAVGDSLRIRIFSRLEKLSVGFFERKHARLLADLATGGAGAVESALEDALLRAIKQLAIIVFGLFLLFSLESRLALACALLLPIVPVGSRLLSNAYDRAQARRWKTMEKQIMLADQSLAAQPVVKVFGLEDEHTATFKRLTIETSRGTRHIALVEGAMAAATAGGGYLVLSAAIGVGTILVLSRSLTLGSMVAFVQLAFAVIRSAQSLTTVLAPMKHAGGALQGADEILRERPAVADVADAMPLPPLAREIRLDAVYFGYRAGDYVLRGVSAVIPRGMRVAFVGSSGCGKSTLLKLLMRMDDPAAGRITFDGVSLRRFTLGSLRRRLGVVFQDTLVFSGSIADNIRIGKPDATDEEVRAAAAGAGLDEQVRLLPDGYETTLTEGGVNMSGGQRQRLGIARALIRDPEIMVLDEATSALDPVSEHAVTEALSQASRGRTVIAVTHRLAQVVDFDHIYVVEAGRVIEEGAHHALLAAGGPYAQLWAKQSGFQLKADVAGSNVEPRRLRLVPIFAGLGPGALAGVARLFDVADAEAGTDLITEGDPADRFYILIRGRVEVVKGGRQVAVLADGDHFGEVALLDSSLRTATVSTQTHCVYATLGREDFEQLVGRLPAVREALRRVQAERAAAEAQNPVHA